MKRIETQVDGFNLTSFQRIRSDSDPIHVYIEGDGLAWITRAQPSADPTPRYAIALSLALKDDAPNVVYMARPCQYNMYKSARCESAYWTDRRFSEEVVAAMGHELDILVPETPAPRIELVGYSGGAAIAVLLAARRSDVISLRTVAGNLDHVAVNRYHNVSAMPGSLNAADFARQLSHLPQIHFSGQQDQIIPRQITQNFVQQVGRCAKQVDLPDASHTNGWTDAWTSLLRVKPQCI